MSFSFRDYLAVWDGGRRTARAELASMLMATGIRGRDLKIAFVVPRMEVGGVEMFIFRLGRMLKERGHTVDIVSAGTQGQWWNGMAEPGFGWRCFEEADSLCPVFHAVKVCRFLRSQRYDVILLNHTMQVAPSLSLLPDAMTVISVVHNHNELVYKVACANWKAWDIAVAVGHEIATVMRHRVPDRQVRTIPYGVELPSQEAWSGRTQLTDELKLLFLGRLAHEQKGIFLLPQILNEIRAQGIDATLTVVGDGPDRDELHRRLKSMCSPGTCVLLPPQSSDRVYRTMLSHHVFLMPSFYEGLPIAALEAQACGCVPIASLLSGVTDFGIAHEKTGFLCPVSNVPGFVAAAVRLAQDHRLWWEMSLAAHEYVSERFTTDVMTTKYLELFAEAKSGHFARQKPRSREQRIDFTVYGWRGVLPNFMRRLAHSAWKQKSELPSNPSHQGA